MKPGPALDCDIALNVMEVEVTDPSKIPPYSTDIYSAYSVIGKLLSKGWACRVGPRIQKDGNLFYQIRFQKGNKHCECIEKTIPFAVCSAAMAISNEQYVEFVLDRDEEKLVQISSSELTGLKKVDVGDEEIIEIINAAVLHGNEQANDISDFSKIILETLKENGYIIGKKEQDTSE